MARVEVLKRFGEVPPLGSHKDIVLRQYLNRELSKEALLAKLSLAANLPLKEQGYKDILREFQKWVSLHYLQDEEVAKEEDRMRQAYEKVITLSPKLIRDKEGSLIVEGLRDFAR